ncbi:MAG: DUF1800 domain-containing protein [Planctomycetes bacterium]|nr:DUF1800 domain-containing protein [Planctomycetota bacterium]
MRPRNRRCVCCGLMAAAAAQWGVGLAPVAAGPLYAAREWDERRAAHLLRRAGFGGTPDEIRHLTDLGVRAAVDFLVDYEEIPQDHPAYQPFAIPNDRTLKKRGEQLGVGDELERRALTKRINQVCKQLQQLQMLDLRAWWIERMVRTKRPLEEKMTFFWHGLFTSGFREVRNSEWMYRQNAFLRENALGGFRDLLVGISQDPAMLKYLDNASNRKDHPNENYARELLELFTMGEGHYTEQDVQEAARALTGWTIVDGKFKFNPKIHDPGIKRFQGRQGLFDGYDIIDIILKRNATSRHLATKLLEFFVRADPPRHLVDALEYELRVKRYDLRETMRTLLSSEAFYSDEAMFSLVKSPVELVVGTVRMLEVEPEDVHALALAAEMMGQNLFQPPNVKGWDGGLKWINTATLFTRYNFAAIFIIKGTGHAGRTDGMGMNMTAMLDAVATLKHDLNFSELKVPRRSIVSGPQPPFDPMAIIESEQLRTNEQVVDHLVQRLLQSDLDPERRRWFLEILSTDRPTDRPDPARVTRLVLAIMCTPEFQVY